MFGEVYEKLEARGEEFVINIPEFDGIVQRAYCSSCASCHPVQAIMAGMMLTICRLLRGHAEQRPESRSLLIQVRAAVTAIQAVTQQLLHLKLRLLARK